MPTTAPNLSGVIPILATPFHDDESLDHASLTRMIEFFAKTGVNAVTLLGVLGESNRLTDSERSALIATAVKAAGALPVIAGCSHTGTAATIALVNEAAALGAAAVMIAPSKQPVPNDELVFTYYSRIAERTTLPIILQDHPASTEVNMSVALILRIAREIPALACIKAEAVPSPAKIAALRTGLETIRPMPILTGLGGLYGFFDLERGSDGFNTGFAFPEVLLAITQRAKAGDLDAAYTLYQRYLPLMVFEQQPGLAVRKEILRRRGVLTSGRVRHPGGNIDPATASQLAGLLDRTFPGQDITRPLAF
ncbi:MAG: 4-hydroxy-tetrahydrodipicolinate synthase [Bryobacterales bacterium]|jgi:4-hydroxy-tetrahydrodipicolinate synthase|nr:4-hydroxy-tetrahydrodipicolinate synthase [Bryobacterales bacterium]